MRRSLEELFLTKVLFIYKKKKKTEACNSFLNEENIFLSTFRDSLSFFNTNVKNL